MHKLNQFRLQVWHRGDLVKCVHPSVHPHVCGERINSLFAPVEDTGSSPRVWGTPLPTKAPTYPARFIPTCVGNAFHVPSVRLDGAVHPHVCGERDSESVFVLQHTGSSPRVWGTRSAFTLQSLSGRFIPTCVGNAWPREIRGITRPVHPHVCGERWGFAWWISGRSGSSPRVWGTQTERIPAPTPTRFIPTCVGNALGRN